MQSELRQDLISGDWTIIAPQRAKRPHLLIKKQKKRKKAPIRGCPFENPQKTDHGKPILIYKIKNKKGEIKKSWWVQVVKNKYPVFISDENKAGINSHICVSTFQKGPYLVMNSKGYHDLVITQGHHQNFADLSKQQAIITFKIFQDRYKMFLNDVCLAYVSIFHNWGAKAGASIYHPHYQIITLPVVPLDVYHSLNGSVKYFEQHKKCAYCVMIDWEKKYRSRIVYENKGAIAFTSFVSQAPFQLKIFPKKHLSFFEDTSQEDLKWVTEALQKVLIAIKKYLNDPDYNFFIHTAPLRDKKKNSHYHWHIEIMPKIGIPAGFELGTGIGITAVDPDVAAKILKNKIKFA